MPSKKELTEMLIDVTNRLTKAETHINTLNCLIRNIDSDEKLKMVQNIIPKNDNIPYAIKCLKGSEKSN
jgi:hypothetical protein